MRRYGGQGEEWDKSDSESEGLEKDNW
jgi:hypothetical protein